MKRLTLAICLLSPLLLVASGRKGSSPRKYVLPRGTTLEVGEQLIKMVDVDMSPESPVQPNNLGTFGTEELPGEESFSSEHLDLPEQIQSQTPTQATPQRVVARRPLSPADLSSDWRHPAQPVPQDPAYDPFQCSRYFRPLKQRSTQQPQPRPVQAQTFAVIGAAKYFHNKNSHR